MVCKSALRRRPGHRVTAFSAVPWYPVGGAPFDPATMPYQRGLLPQGAVWAAFGIGRHQFPAVAQAVLLGGHVRVGLENNLWLDRGVCASNDTLVEKAAKIMRLIGIDLATPAEARVILGL